jgi:hypothetical protein
MKTKMLLIGMAALMLAVAVPSFAADTATAGAGGTIASAIAISQDTSMDLEFGIIKPGTNEAGSTVKIDPTPEATLRTKVGDCVLLNGITPALAVFTVTGAPNATYGITLPGDTVPVEIHHNTDSMTVTNFASEPSGSGKIASNGEQKLNVGATLHVAKDQAVGRYTGSFDVLVAYN